MRAASGIWFEIYTLGLRHFYSFFSTTVLCTAHIR